MSAPPATDRTALRRQLLSERLAWSQTEQARQAQAQLEAQLRTVLSQLEPDCLGLYWPMQGEFNPRPLALAMAPLVGCQLALPYARRNPVEMHFRLWDGSEPSEQDECRIPTSSGRPVAPDVLLVPCVGFSEQGGRLGYGGGYFDRYLAAHPGVTAVGLAWDEALIPSGQWAAQAHDQALMAVITPTRIHSA